MQVKEIQDKNIWDHFVVPLAVNTFLQSWEWKRVQESDGENVFMLGFYDEENLVAVALVILVHAKRGNYFLVPHGPIVKDEKYLKDVLQELKEYCERIVSPPYQGGARGGQSAVALRIAPLSLNTPEHTKLFQELQFRDAPMHVHAELTWVLDISKPEQEIVSGMRKTTRHAIKKAEQAGVQVEIIADASGLERFWPLYEQTTTRHGFTAFKKELIASQAEEFGKTGSMFFAIASYDGVDTAGAMFIQYGDTVFYYHGASIKTSVPAAQLLQWRAMQEAKKRGATRYNFWGIAREDEPNHPFAGITVFKKGFGGYAVDLLHAQDFPLSWKYWPMWMLEMFRKKKRGF